MKYDLYNFSQKDEKWKNKKIGNSNVTIGSHGCLLTAFSNITGITPDSIADIAYENGCIDSEGNLNSVKLAKILKVEYEEPIKVKTKPPYPCIAETNYYAPVGVPQHFFVADSGNMIIDSFDGKLKDNIYKNNMVSYRRFKPKQSSDEFEQSWEFMKTIKVFSENTEKDEKVTTDRLAVFFQRLINYMRETYHNPNDFENYQQKLPKEIWSGSQPYRPAQRNEVDEMIYKSLKNINLIQ